MTSNSAVAEASQKTVCVVQDPTNPDNPLPIPAACAQAILTTTDPLCETRNGVYSCSVTAVLILTVSGPTTCGKGSSDATPSLEVCTLATPARGQTHPQENRYGGIPPGGREQHVSATVCARLSFNDPSTYSCKTWVHRIWLPGPVSANLDSALLEVNGLAGYATTQAPDTEPVVIVGP